MHKTGGLGRAEVGQNLSPSSAQCVAMHIAVLCSPESWYLEGSAARRRRADRDHAADVSRLAAELGPAGRADSPAAASTWRRSTPCWCARCRPGTLEQVVFRMDVLGRLEAAGKVVINPPRAIEAAVDKYLASAKLAAGRSAHAAHDRLPDSRRCRCRRSSGWGATWCSSRCSAPRVAASPGSTTRPWPQRAFSLLAQLGAVLYLQEFIPHDGYDLRVLVVGQRMWAMRRRNPLDWRTNVSRGATAEPVELTPELADLARRAADAIGAPLAGVDCCRAATASCTRSKSMPCPAGRRLSRTLKRRHRPDVLESSSSRECDPRPRKREWNSIAQSPMDRTRRCHLPATLGR